MKLDSRCMATATLVGVMFLAVPVSALAEGAVVIRDDGCEMVDQYGLVTVLSESNVRVGTFSRNCNSTVQCKATGVTNSSGKAIHHDYDSTGGLPCSTGFGYTTDWHQIISKSGVAHLVCHVNTCAVCGDGLPTAPETCDDGNTNSGDGCSDSCATEAGYICEGVPNICEPVCDAGETDCGGTCVDLDSDAANCGSCETVCAAGETCTGGICVPPCAAGETDCGGTCVDLDIDEDNCGSCGTVCAAGETCTNGACVSPCAAGETDCSGTCVDLDNDEENCGSCGTVCTIGESCTDGACVSPCAAGETDCSGTCVDLNNDEENCGSCGTVCTIGDTCTDGACVATCAAPSTLFGCCQSDLTVCNEYCELAARDVATKCCSETAIAVYGTDESCNSVCECR